MFGWLRKRGSVSSLPMPAKKNHPVAVSSLAAAPPLPTGFEDTTPLPSVVGEGNTQADWNAWEDSVTTLDSQMQSLLPTDRVYVRDTRPSQLDDLDPFASVRGKRDS